MTSKIETTPIEPYAIYNLDETSRLLRIDKTTVYKLVKKGKLPRNKVGKGYKFLGEHLLDFMSSPTISRMKLNLEVK